MSMKETDKLLAITESVVYQSATQWQEDVKNRKMTIVNGTGVVHGVRYNLQADYDIKDRIVK